MDFDHFIEFAADNNELTEIPCAMVVPLEDALAAADFYFSSGKCQTALGGRASVRMKNE